MKDNKLKNSFIKNIYSNPVNLANFIGIIQLLIGEAVFIYCIFNINDIGIQLMMLLFFVSFSFALYNYKKSSFSEGAIKAITYIRLKLKDNLNEKEKVALEFLEKDKKLKNIVKNVEIVEKEYKC